MSESRHLRGIVYILSNEEANRVKVGVTNSSVENRCINVNQLWLGTKGTCQACGIRLHLKRYDRKKLMPIHVGVGSDCPGGRALPLEKDSSLAKIRLEKLKKGHEKLTGSTKGSNTRRINVLEERIKKFEKIERQVGVWKINTVYHTDNAVGVEKRAHEILNGSLDENMPLGEVFSCPVERAREVVETTLKELGVSDSATKAIY